MIQINQMLLICVKLYTKKLISFYFITSNNIKLTTMNRQEIEIELGIELPDNFESCDITTQELIIDYLNQLDMIAKKAYTIGKEHLGTSFNLVKSNGFINWKKNNK